MKILIIGLLSLFLIGSFDGVSHAKTHEKTKSEIVKMASIDIVYAIETNEVINLCPVFITANSNYVIAESAKLSLTDKLLYLTLRQNKNSWGDLWVGCDSKNKTLNSKTSNKKKANPKKFNLSFYNKPKLC